MCLQKSGAQIEYYFLAIFHDFVQFTVPLGFLLKYSAHIRYSRQWTICSTTVNIKASEKFVFFSKFGDFFIKNRENFFKFEIFQEIFKMKVFIVACALISVAVAQTVEQPLLKECFEKDSISCVQQTVRIINQFHHIFQSIRTLKVFHSSVWKKKRTEKN